MNGVEAAGSQRSQRLAEPSSPGRLPAHGGLTQAGRGSSAAVTQLTSDRSKATIPPKVFRGGNARKTRQIQ